MEMLLQDLLEVVVQLVDAEGIEVAAGPSAFIADCTITSKVTDPHLIDKVDSSLLPSNGRKIKQV